MIGRRGFGSEEASAQTPFANAWSAICEAENAVEKPFLARKGQALIWCANLLHGGSTQADLTLTRWSQVTHYFFEDCIYYTPAFSDEALGRLATRNLIAVNDRAPRPNLYLREALQDPAGRPSKGDLVRRWLRRLRGSV